MLYVHHISILKNTQINTPYSMVPLYLPRDYYDYGIFGGVLKRFPQKSPKTYFFLVDKYDTNFCPQKLKFFSESTQIFYLVIQLMCCCLKC